MTFLSQTSLIRLRLAQIASHLVVALIALVVVGGATRVMEAGLACPDWPLCYGKLLPGHQMNIQVFLEWFHRLDAFLIGLALLIQFVLAWIWRAQLSRWLLFIYGFLVFLVILQGGLGALTVLQLLPSGVVTAHLALAMTLVAVMSSLSQRLLSSTQIRAPIWWRSMGGISILAVFAQSILGGRMATTWAARRCLDQGQSCQLLDLHSTSALIVTACISLFAIVSVLAGGWPRSQWPWLIAVLALVVSQILLGLLTVHYGLNQPMLTVAHQLVAALLIAFLSALSVKNPQVLISDKSATGNNLFWEASHG